MNTRETEELFKNGNAYLDKFQQIVDDAIKEEELIVRNLLNPPQEIVTRGQKISDKVARFGGSWKFIIVFALVLAAWIVFNVVGLGNITLIRIHLF